MAPATKRRRPVGVGDPIGPLAALPGRLLVDFPGQLAEKRVGDDALIELRILAPAVLARIVDEEFTLADRRRTEGVGLDDVGAGLEEAAMDVADHRRLGQREEIAVVEQILGGVPEAIAADVRLGHPVGANRRAHRAVDDRDAMLKHVLQRVPGSSRMSS